MNRDWREQANRGLVQTSESVSRALQCAYNATIIEVPDSAGHLSLQLRPEGKHTDSNCLDRE